MAKKIVPPRVSNQESPHERDTRGALSELSNSPLLDGSAVRVTFAASTPKRVQHNLGRVIRGFFPILKPANCDVWLDGGQGTSSYVSLICSEDVTVTLWIF